jgi:hypothetical protein
LVQKAYRGISSFFPGFLTSPISFHLIFPLQDYKLPKPRCKASCQGLYGTAVVISRCCQ